MERKRTLPDSIQGLPTPSAVLDLVSSFERKDLFTVLEYVSGYTEGFSFGWFMNESKEPILRMFFHHKSVWVSSVIDAFKINSLFSHADFATSRTMSRISGKLSTFGFVSIAAFSKSTGIPKDSLRRSSSYRSGVRLRNLTQNSSKGALFFFDKSFSEKC